MKQETQKKILLLEHNAYFLKKICDIRKILLSNGAYSVKNMESQEVRFLNANVPDWEKQIIRDSWNITQKLSHGLLKELDILDKEILKELGE